jgi:RNA recognition motif-containing protein
MKKLYVGNLSYEMDDNQLRELFSDYGEVQSSSVITDKFSGKSRGFGFVEIGDAEAERAIAEKNGFEYQGRKLVVNEARPREEKRDFGGGGGGRRDRGGYDRRF